MKTFKVLLSAILLSALAVSCKTEYDILLQSNDSEAKYQAAFNYFNTGKYSRAAALFESLAVLTSGTARDDTVQYYWGLSNYSNEDYETAETNFTNFIANFPRSPFTEPASFLRIDCMYRSTLRYELDQTPTYAAITAIGQYLLENPEGPNAIICRRMMQELNDRLDRKAYENAKLYYTMEDYMAARVALKNVLKDDADNIYREDILYYSAMSSYKYADMSVPAKQHERFLTFEDDYLNFIGEFPDSKYRKELDHLYSKARERK
ncbi:MAG: outer membrane protein assembly factor BamD [Bacteroidales bacterium]|nr:outer membrane protein assembly factor BamD [Bacteroidales bacterium]